MAPSEPLPPEIAALTGCELNELIAKEANAWFGDEALAAFAEEQARWEAWRAEKAAEAEEAAAREAERKAAGKGEFGKAGTKGDRFSFEKLGVRDTFAADTRVKPTYVPKPLAELDTIPIRFTQVITPEVAVVEDEVCAFLTSLKSAR